MKDCPLCGYEIPVEFQNCQNCDPPWKDNKEEWWDRDEPHGDVATNPTAYIFSKEAAEFPIDERAQLDIPYHLYHEIDENRNLETFTVDRAVPMAIGFMQDGFLDDEIANELQVSGVAEWLIPEIIQAAQKAIDAQRNINLFNQRRKAALPPIDPFNQQNLVDYTMKDLVKLENSSIPYHLCNDFIAKGKTKEETWDYYKDTGGDIADPKLFELFWNMGERLYELYQWEKAFKRQSDYGMDNFPADYEESPKFTEDPMYNGINIAQPGFNSMPPDHQEKWKKILPWLFTDDESGPEYMTDQNVNTYTSARYPMQEDEYGHPTQRDLGWEASRFMLQMDMPPFGPLAIMFIRRGLDKRNGLYQVEYDNNNFGLQRPPTPEEWDIAWQFAEEFNSADNSFKAFEAARPPDDIFNQFDIRNDLFQRVNEAKPVFNNLHTWPYIRDMAEGAESKEECWQWIHDNLPTYCIVDKMTPEFFDQVWNIAQNNSEYLNWPRKSNEDWHIQYNYHIVPDVNKKRCETCSAFKEGKCRMFNDAPVTENGYCTEWSQAWEPKQSAQLPMDENQEDLSQSLWNRLDEFTDIPYIQDAEAYYPENWDIEDAYETVVAQYDAHHEPAPNWEQWKIAWQKAAEFDDIWKQIKILYNSPFRQGALPPANDEQQTFGLERKILKVYAPINPQYDFEAGDVSYDDTDEDEYDFTNEMEPALEAYRMLVDLGITEPSSSNFYAGGWYSGEEEVSAHLQGFTPQEEQQVSQMIHDDRYRHFEGYRESALPFEPPQNNSLNMSTEWRPLQEATDWNREQWWNDFWAYQEESRYQQDTGDRGPNPYPESPAYICPNCEKVYDGDVPEYNEICPNCGEKLWDFSEYANDAAEDARQQHFHDIYDDPQWEEPDYGPDQITWGDIQRWESKVAALPIWEAATIIREMEDSRENRRRGSVTCECGSTQCASIEGRYYCTNCLSPWKYDEKDLSTDRPAAQQQQYTINTVGAQLNPPANQFSLDPYRNQPLHRENLDLFSIIKYYIEHGDNFESAWESEQGGIEAGAYEPKTREKFAQAWESYLLYLNRYNDRKKWENRQTNNVADNDSPSRYINIQVEDLSKRTDPNLEWLRDHELCRHCQKAKAGLTGYCPECNESRKQFITLASEEEPEEDWYDEMPVEEEEYDENQPQEDDFCISDDRNGYYVTFGQGPERKYNKSFSGDEWDEAIQYLAEIMDKIGYYPGVWHWNDSYYEPLDILQKLNEIEPKYQVGEVVKEEYATGGIEWGEEYEPGFQPRNLSDDQMGFFNQYGDAVIVRVDRHTDYKYYYTIQQPDGSIHDTVPEEYIQPNEKVAKVADILQNDIADANTYTTDLHTFTDPTLPDLRHRDNDQIDDIQEFMDDQGNVHFVYTDGKIYWGRSVDDIISRNLLHTMTTYTQAALSGIINIETGQVVYDETSEINQTSDLKDSFLFALRRTLNTYVPDGWYQPNDDIMHSNEEIYDNKMH